MAMCLCCGNDVGERDIRQHNFAQCKRCYTPHHRDCFEYTKQCAVFGCLERKYFTTPRETIPDKISLPEKILREYIHKKKHHPHKSRGFLLDDIVSRHCISLEEKQKMTQLLEQYESIQEEQKTSIWNAEGTPPGIAGIVGILVTVPAVTIGNILLIPAGMAIAYAAGKAYSKWQISAIKKKMKTA